MQFAKALLLILHTGSFRIRCSEHTANGDLVPNSGRAAVGELFGEGG
jgi:hypothetical protein